MHDDIGEKGVNVACVPEIESALSKNHADGFLNILSFHSGLEHVHLPGKMDYLFARRISKKVPYIHYGHHPHVPQSYETIDDSHIFYSLGNFCFDDVYSQVSSQPLVTMSEQNKICLIPILNITNNLVHKVELFWFKIGDIAFELLTPEKDNFITTVRNSLVDRALDDFIKERSEILKRHKKKRTASRDLEWYLKRLNIHYLKLALNSRRNAKLYRSNFVNYLKA
ncbi:CapA family protein [Parahaliea sp. F7430]|uniref:CapA family protein n=1 Tax=Sediminihaliea albiluteola TaxID=2758564 RepID=A0A7W2TUN7_9GAMM|nr:CapA family protein [Sediminihaliea albiluteola]